MSDMEKQYPPQSTGPPPPYNQDVGPIQTPYPQPPPQQFQAAYPPPVPMSNTTPMVQHVKQTQYVNTAGQPVYVTQVTQKHTDSDSTFNNMRSAIPVMPMSLAIFCCFWNFVFPGMGTVIASFSVFCCANPGQSTGGKFGCFCLNFWIGWLQLFTIWIFLLGWIWSIMWGWAFVVLSAEYQQQQRTIATTTFVGTTPAVYPAQGNVNNVVVYKTNDD